MIQLSPSQPSLFRIVGRILLLAVFTVEHGPGPIDDLPTSNMVILPLWQLCQLTKRFVEKLGRAIQKKTQTIDDAINNLKDVQSKCFVNPSFLAGFLTGWNIFMKSRVKVGTLKAP